MIAHDLQLSSNQQGVNANRLNICTSTGVRHQQISFAEMIGHNLQVSSNQRGVNASQLNIGGTGLGSFNDRFRDAVVGGSPFASPQFQGWVTGGLSTFDVVWL